MKTALDWARAACDTMIRKFDAPDLPPVRHFHYHQGVFLSGMNETRKLCGEEKYFDYMKAWIDSVFDADGKIIQYTHANLDDIMPGILLFPILDRTGDPYYEKCLASVIAQVRDIPRNDEGGYWHKDIRPGQMWLDGLYMAGPFCAEYAARYHEPALADDVVHQALLMEKKTKDPATGLLYHAYDSLRKEAWADPVTGCSSEFWGRSTGWVGMAVLNDLDFLPEDINGRDEMIRMVTELLTVLCRYQSDEGRWYQVTDKGAQPGNWLENSCSCLYVAALSKAVRMGFLDPALLAHARRGYDAVIASLEQDGDDVLIGNVCIGTGVGNYEHYCNRPTSVNDLHGVGAFLIMCTEVQKLINTGIAF